MASILRWEGGSPLYGVTGERLRFRPLHPEGWTQKAWAVEALHAPWMKVATKPALPPLAGSLGNLFPGPSRLSKPWPAQPWRCWLRFPHFLVFSSPLPQALPALWPSPHPPVPELDPREGECWKRGQGGGAGRLLRQHQEGAGIEESPAASSWNGGRLLPLSLFLPSLPQGLALSRSKVERPTSLAAPQICL